MKVTIDEKGMMMVSPETRLEAFALREWCGLAFTNIGSVNPRYFMVTHELPAMAQGGGHD